MKNLTISPRRATALVLASIVSIGTIGAAGAPPHSPAPETAAAEDSAYSNEIQEFIAANPGDFSGLEALTQELYDAPPLEITTDLADQTVTAAEADQLLADFAAEPSDASTMRVPVDAFTVSFTWVAMPNALPIAYGYWDFRDDYVNGSAPHDIASLRLDTGSTCIRIGQTSWGSYNYQGASTSEAGYLFDSGLSTNASVVGLQDSATNFMLNIDHGFMTSTLYRGCGRAADDAMSAQQSMAGVFTFEHNQDGGNVIGVDASFGFFGVNYDAIVGKLQKSTQISYY